VGVSRVEDGPLAFAIFRVTGDNDAYDADILERALEAARPDAHGVVIDLREASFVDSTFVGVMLVEAKNREQRLAVVVPQERSNAVSRLFELAHLADALPVYRDLDQGLAAVTGDVAPHVH
jgi:anti-anti-sigma factor